MMPSRVVFLATLLGAGCGDVAASWSPEAGDYDVQGLSLLQLRFASVSLSSNSEETKDVAASGRAQAPAEQALPWAIARPEAPAQRPLPWAAARAEAPAERKLPWATPHKEEVRLLDTSKLRTGFVGNSAEAGGPTLSFRRDDGTNAEVGGVALFSSDNAAEATSFASGCHFTKAVAGVSPGNFNKITHDVKTLNECYKLCDEEGSCSAVTFKAARNLCITLPRKYDGNYKKRGHGPLVSNRVCPASLSAGGAGGSGCTYSTAIRGHSPGPMIAEHKEVATLEACQKLCSADEQCLAVVLRQRQRRCFTLARTYNENYEVSSDDAIASNKICTF